MTALGSVDASDLPEPPQAGERTFVEARRVQLGDTGATGAMRLDALSRLFQDIADTDATESGLVAAGGPWVLRRAHFRIGTWPAFRQTVELRTWCTGIGSCWAQRRTTTLLDGDALVEGEAIWVHVDPGTGRPRRPPEGFAEVYGGRAVSRRVDARLHLPAEPPAEATWRTWPLRAADVDVMGHVNNAAALAAVHELLAERGQEAPLRVDVEHRGALDPAPDPRLAVVADADGFTAWLLQGSTPALVGRVATRPG